jgi:hypothetical protein
MTLYERFFEAAQLDLEAAKVANREVYIYLLYIIYNRAYEKCIKSYFVFKEVSINHTSEADVYNKIKTRIHHETGESRISLLKGLADTERGANERKLSTNKSKSKIL